MNRLFPYLLAVGLLGPCIPGCTTTDKHLDLAIEQVKPVLEKAVAEAATQTAQFQGSAQGINPGYTVIVEGDVRTGFRGVLTVRLDGVAGQVSGATQAENVVDADAERG